jgi:hypothetical protein
MRRCAEWSAYASPHVEDADGVSIMAQRAGHPGAFDLQRLTNAHLAAAAPSLLEATQAAVRYLQSQPLPDAEAELVYRTLRDAIEQAVTVPQEDNE